jgi:NAD(P)-dependent dehydrogenase (short-subunit alcohol dehydrogenase family)
MMQRVLDDPMTGDAVRGMEIPLGRLAEPAEVAGLVFFLCGAEASYMHGGCYYIDGGIDAQIRPDSF